MAPTLLITKAMRISFIAALLVACASVGCAEQARDLEPVPATDDALIHFDLVPQLADEANIAELSDDGEFIGAVSVAYGPKSDDERKAFVSGTMVTFTADAGTVDIEVSKTRWNPLSTGYLFLFYTRAAGSEEAWTPYEFVYPGRGARFRWYDEASILVESSKFQTDPSGDGVSVDFTNDLPSDARSLEYGVFVIPYLRVFRTLEGDHEYRLNVTCDGAPCPENAAAQ